MYGLGGMFDVMLLAVFVWCAVVLSRTGAGHLEAVQFWLNLVPSTLSSRERPHLLESFNSDIKCCLECTKRVFKNPGEACAQTPLGWAALLPYHQETSSYATAICV